MAVSATYFDGQSARDREVTVSEDGTNVSFSGRDTPYVNWSIKGLHPIDPPSPGQPYRLTHDDKPGARLIVRDQAFIDQLVSRSKHLKGGYSARDIWNIIGWTAGGLAACGLLTYLALIILPGPIAKILPNSWRERTGAQMEEALVDGAKRCNTSEGEHALGQMVANLANGSPDMPSISVHVYDISILNAFALTGGRVVVTRELLNKADRPEELAGVLAHEIGHVAYLHPEAQVVRISGLEVLSSVFTGTNGGNTATNVALIATVLRHSQVAETEADTYARETLEKARIDPAGLKTFFEKILKLEKDNEVKSGPLSALGNIFSTHPGTEDRIKLINPLPAGVQVQPVLSETDWQALRKICG